MNENPANNQSTLTETQVDLTENTATTENIPESTYPETQTEKPNKFRAFLGSTLGYYVMIVVFALVVWGIMLLSWSLESILFPIIALVCAFFGWRALSGIQPDMFLWMSIAGWVTYFMLKLLLSVMIGVFVTPFKIARWIANKINLAAM